MHGRAQTPLAQGEGAGGTWIDPGCRGAQNLSPEQMAAPEGPAWADGGRPRDCKFRSRAHSKAWAESSREGESEAARCVHCVPGTGPRASCPSSPLTCPVALEGKIPISQMSKLIGRRGELVSG